MTSDRYAAATTAMALVLAISVAIALAGLTWRLMGDDGRHGPPPVMAPPPKPVDIAPILGFAPFGAAIGPSSGAASLDLHLRAIFFAVPRSRSTAVIGSGVQPVVPYGVGQVLPGGATLEAVEIDHVLLRVNGRLQILPIDKPHPSGSAPAAASLAAPALSPSLASASPIAAAMAASAPAPPPIAGANDPNRVVEVMRQRALQSPQALVGSLGATATSSGYRVGPNPPSGVRAAGLQAGDVIERINGVTVGDLQNDRRTFDQAIISGQARIEAVRDGKRLTLSFPLR